MPPPRASVLPVSYRIYFRNQHGFIIGRDDYSAVDDEQAMAVARALSPSGEIRRVIAAEAVRVYDFPSSADAAQALTAERHDLPKATRVARTPA